MKIGSRSQGKSAVASNAYREGKKITDERTGVVHDYSKKSDVIESLTITPSYAPESFCDSDRLWNEVEKIEKRKDAQLFREVEVSLPRELNHQQNKALTLEFVKQNFIEKGMCATVSFHKSKSENPHSHIMLTTRTVDQNGFGKKDRSWNARDLVENWRKSWADITNEHLKKNNIEQTIDHRSFERQGIDKKPTIHLGYVANEMEKRGVKSERGDLNREVERSNVSSLSSEMEMGIAQARDGLKHYRQQKIQQEKALKEQQQQDRQRTKGMGMSR